MVYTGICISPLPHFFFFCFLFFFPFFPDPGCVYERFSLPVVAYSIAPDLAGFNERGNWCDINVPIDTTLYVYGCVPIIGAFGLSFQMRKVRKQMNFFRMQVCAV